MPYNFRYDAEKNASLLITRGIGFEDIIESIQLNGVLGFIDNPVSGREHQKLFIVECSGYTYTIPAIDEGGGRFFLKTIIPSRKYRKRFFSNTL